MPAIPPPPRQSYLGDLLVNVFERSLAPLRAQDPRPMPELCAALMHTSGEGTALDLGAAILQRYHRLDEAGRRAFFDLLTDGYDIDPQVVSAAARAYADTPAPATYAALMQAAEPPRQELFRRLNQGPGATAALVALRADLLALKQDTLAYDRIDQDLRHLLRSWFNRGFLVLRRINWQSPANVLERIIAYEAVHAINDWDDLRRRVQPADRRCFAFFHPCMPDDPLIFVEVALTKGTPSAIQDVLAENRAPLDASEIDTAVFYSISNCQKGLAGITFGNALIKQVVADLAQEMPQISTFVTLSPIPGLTSWRHSPGASADPETAPEAIADQAADYLLNAKRPDGAPLDPVARFHLANGARVEAVHGAADLSENGLRASFGAMVNYRYDLRHVRSRSEAYAETRTIAASRQVQSQAKQGQKRRPPPQT